MNISSMGPQISESKISKSKIRPALLIFLILVIVGIAFYGYFNYDKKNIIPAKQITGLEIALKTATFLDTLFNPDGSFSGGYFCGGDRPCLRSKSEIQHFGYAILAHYDLAKATGDESFKEKSDKSINLVLDGCKDNYFYCEWNFWPIAQYYNDTKEDKYLKQGLLPPVEKFMNADDREFLEGGFGAKLAVIYEATKEPRYKNRIIEVADLRLKGLVGSFGGKYNESLYAQTLYLPAYRISGDSKYLSAAEKIFDEFELSKNLDQLTNTLPTIAVAETFLELEELSQKKGVYKNEAYDILQELLFKAWDTPDNLKFNGDYGFIDFLIKNERVPKEMLKNGRLISLFLEFRDVIFENPQVKK